MSKLLYSLEEPQARLSSATATVVNEGFEDVKCDFSSNKSKAIGKADPMKLRERVEQKTKKKVELISPLPKKDNDGGDMTKDERNILILNSKGKVGCRLASSCERFEAVRT
ncbi:hypothetical protein NE237_015446 [Protea cynaroides]|uniref:Uncharacterized protein n=1 Tax=Protea cynaroides TaxID=273540 RepID=A0A9Q0QR28_9MAGN|nr:hypothetical protein NE237_015446 [Protea cynaroides]